MRSNLNNFLILILVAVSSLLVLSYFADFKSIPSQISRPVKLYKICIQDIPNQWNLLVLDELAKTTRSTWKPVYLNEDGYGPYLNSTNLFDTNQFASDLLFYHQLKSSVFAAIPCKDADLVFVPSLIAGLIRLGKFDPLKTQFTNNITQFLPLINLKPHFAIFGRIELETKLSYGSKLLEKPLHPNMW